MNFGAFVQIAEGVEGLVHISEIVADRRINHPRDAVREGQRVKALVLAIDSEKRQIKLSMKQLIPTSIDEYIAEHKAGDQVSGRVVELTASGAIVELGEGIRAALNAKTGRTAAAHFSASCSVDAKLRAARSFAALLHVESSLERQRPRAVSHARAPRREPDPHLQNHKARCRFKED